MKTQLNNKKIFRIKLNSWLIAITCLLIVISHNFFSTTNVEYQKENKEYKTLIKERNKSLESLKATLNCVDCNETEIKKNIESYIGSYEKASSQFKKLSKISSNQKILGFRNINTFLFQTSVFIVIFILSLLLKWNARFSKYEYIKSIMNKISTVFTFISIYYLIWVFFPSTDLPYTLHLLAVIVLTILVSAITLFTIKCLFNRELKIELYKYNITNLWRFIIKDVPEKHIPYSKMNEYVEDYTREIENFKVSK